MSVNLCKIFFLCVALFQGTYFAQCATFGGAFSLLNVNAPETNIPQSFKVQSNGQMAITWDEKGICEGSPDLKTWYGLGEGTKYVAKMDQGHAFFRVKKAMPRPSQMYLPKNYDSQKKYPLILNLHGYTGDWNHQNGYFPLQKHADNKGFIFCVPDGERDSDKNGWNQYQGNRRWNSIDACCGTRHDLLDDSAYLRALIDQAINNYSIDMERIYVMGFSNGAQMAFRMAIDHSDIIAGIVSIGGISYKDTSYAPKFPVHVLAIHGTKEENYHGTVLGEIAFYYADTPSVRENLQNWAAFNNCSEYSEQENALDLVRLIRGNESNLIIYKNPETQCTVELWEVVNGVHVENYSSKMKEMLVDWMLARPKIRN